MTVRHRNTTLNTRSNSHPLDFTTNEAPEKARMRTPSPELDAATQRLRAQPVGESLLAYHPEVHPQCSVTFSEEDLDTLSELLVIAQQDLLATATMVEGKAVAPALLESLRTYAEYAADLRERIEAR